MTGPIVIVLGPIATLIALMIVVPMRRSGLFPSHGSAFWAGCLMISMALGGLFASSTVWAFVVDPAQLQSALLGKQYGTPSTLRFYSEAGFQDQSRIWRYA
ncbi:MAG: hypothetical protein J0626_07720, partial [Rhodospirillaceae bacterium]|nr:hypothetical protein [Rhodospirillaceae bacterium]